MAVIKLTIEDFLQKAAYSPVLDVRSPGEFAHAHIHGAHSFPLFTDEERKVVGTAYKQQSREKAIKIGLVYFGVKMEPMVTAAENIIAEAHKNNPDNAKTVLVHCWRGGMRSAAIAWLLDLYGFKVYTLAGGYKAFRNWVLQQFQLNYPFKVLGGFTGSGKTEVLQQMAQHKAIVIDLEALAHHRGSAFGSLGQLVQPSQEMFENKLALQLYSAMQQITENQMESADRFIWLEDESQRIGTVNLTAHIFQQKQAAPVFFIDIPFNERLDYILSGYGKFDKEQLVNAIIRIKKRLGGLETKNAINFILEDDIKSAFAILLTYYDKLYTKGLHQRNNLNELLHKINCNMVNAAINSNAVLHHNASMGQAATQP